MTAQARARFVALLNMMHKIRPPRYFVFTGTSGWPVNETSETGLTPLFMAVRWQQPDMVEYLLQHGADVNHSLPGWPSVLEVASCLQDDEILQMLRHAGAQPKPAAQLREERDQRGAVPLSVWFPSAALPLYHAALNGDQDRAITFIRTLSKDEEFAKRLLGDYFPSFPIQHFVAQLCPEVVIHWLGRLLEEACLEGEHKLAVALVGALRELAGKAEYLSRYHADAMEAAGRLGRMSLIQELCEVGLSAAGAAFTAAIQNGHDKLARYCLEGGRVPLWSRYVPTASIFSTGGMVIVENVLEILEVNGRAEGVEILAPYTSEKRADQARRQISRWQKAHGRNEAPPNCDPLAETPDWRNGRPDVLKKLGRTRRSKARRQQPVRNSLPTEQELLTAMKSGLQEWNQRQNQREKQLRKRRRTSQGGIVSFDYHNAVVFVRSDVGAAAEALASDPRFGAHIPAVDQKMPQRFPRECALVLRIRGHEWSALLLPARLQPFELLESLAEQLSRHLKTDALAYCVADVAGVLQYAHFLKGKLKERLDGNESEVSFKSPSRQIRKAEVERNPYERAEDLFLDLELFESGITYELVREGLIEHGGWPTGKAAIWAHPIERIDLVRLQRKQDV